MNAIRDVNCKVLILGESQVGKSSILNMFTERRFMENLPPTLGIDYKIMRVDVGGAMVKLQIWDTAGQERFRSITDSFYRNCQAILLVFDVSDRDSFLKIINWLNDIHEKTNNNVVIALLGNKYDLRNEQGVCLVPHEEIQKVVDIYNIQYFPTSAKTNMNITEAFMFIARQVNEKNLVALLDDQKIDVKSQSKKKKKCCQ